MPISFACACGQRLRAKDEWAGKRIKCPKCGTPCTIPTDDDANSTYQVANTPVPQRRSVDEQERIQAAERERARLQAIAAERYKDILADRPERSLRDFSYWLLLLFLIPLVFSLLGEEDSVVDRLERTIDNAPRELQSRIIQIESALEDGKGDPDELFKALPGGRIEGAHLPKKTFVHYLYGLVAAGGFFALGLILVPSEGSQSLHLLLTGLFTGTVGILLLLLAQFLAAATQ